MQYRYITSLTSFGAAMEWWPVKPLEYGLEPRFPLLDKRLADFVMAAPLEIWAHPGSGNSKLLMRQAMADVLPEKIRQRPHTKTSWNEYIKHMMHNQAREALRDMFTNTQMARQRFVDDQILLAEFEAYCDGTSKQRYSKFFYFPICLEQWLRTHAIGGTTVCFNRLQPWQFEGGCNKLCDEDRRGGIDYG